jgi:hypothetical protein
MRFRALGGSRRLGGAQLEAQLDLDLLTVLLCSFLSERCPESSRYDSFHFFPLSCVQSRKRCTVLLEFILPCRPPSKFCYLTFPAPGPLTKPNCMPTTMATSLPSHVEKAFEIAKSEFLRNLKQSDDYDFSKFSSIDDVYDTTEKIQEEQARTGNMRHLSRIKPYLEALSQYIGVLDTFSQVKSDITSLIWVSSTLIIC